MNSPAHVFISLGILGNRIKPAMAGAIILGSLAPDIPSFIFYFYEKVILNTPESIIWSEKYYQAQWNYIFDIFHSIPLSVIAVIILILTKNKWGAYFFACIFIHSIFDFVLHNSDAHRHFLPFSDYRFFSPVSYWDIRHYGNIVMPIEVLASVFFMSRYLKELELKKIKYFLYFLLVVYSGNILVGFLLW